MLNIFNMNVDPFREDDNDKTNTNKEDKVMGSQNESKKKFTGDEGFIDFMSKVVGIPSCLLFDAAENKDDSVQDVLMNIFKKLVPEELHAKAAISNMAATVIATCVVVKTVFGFDLNKKFTTKASDISKLVSLSIADITTGQKELIKKRLKKIFESHSEFEDVMPALSRIYNFDSSKPIQDLPSGYLNTIRSIYNHNNNTEEDSAKYSLQELTNVIMRLMNEKSCDSLVQTIMGTIGSIYAQATARALYDNHAMKEAFDKALALIMVSSTITMNTADNFDFEFEECKRVDPMTAEDPEKTYNENMKSFKNVLKSDEGKYIEIIRPHVDFPTEHPISEQKLLRSIERYARVCYKSEDKITNDSARKMVKRLIKSGHLAMLEHESISMIFTCDRGVSHEIVRHRVASYAQESTRYCNYSKGKFGNVIKVIDPSYGFGDTMTENMIIAWKYGCNEAAKSYFKMIEEGAQPQFARDVLPTSTATTIVVTMNIREWRHFFELRSLGTTGAPHPQMQCLADEALTKMYASYPTLFSDLYDKRWGITESEED